MYTLYFMLLILLVVLGVALAIGLVFTAIFLKIKEIKEAKDTRNTTVESNQVINIEDKLIHFFYLQGVNLEFIGKNKYRLKEEESKRFKEILFSYSLERDFVIEGKVINDEIYYDISIQEYAKDEIEDYESNKNDKSVYEKVLNKTYYSEQFLIELLHSRYLAYRDYSLIEDDIHIKIEIPTIIVKQLNKLVEEGVLLSSLMFKLKSEDINDWVIEIDNKKEYKQLILLLQDVLTYKYIMKVGRKLKSEHIDDYLTELEKKERYKCYF